MSESSNNKSVLTLIGWSLLITVLWAGWLTLAQWQPARFGSSSWRAIVRVMLVLAPALIYIKRTHQPLLDGLFLRKFALRGVGVGLLVAGLHAAVLFGSGRLGNGVQALPTSSVIWFNFIVGSPFAEEAWFRAALLPPLVQRFGRWQGIVVSASLFALFHIPQWAVAQMALGTILQNAATIALYGVVFGVLFERTQSLWAALIPHWANNLFAQLIS